MGQIWGKPTERKAYINGAFRILPPYVAHFRVVLCYRACGDLFYKVSERVVLECLKSSFLRKYYSKIGGD